MKRPVLMGLKELNERLSASFKERFALENQLGAGAFGLVVKAHQIALNRQVAIKFLLNKEARQSDALKRFKREAQTLARLRHPNIVQVFEFGEDSGIAFIVEELLEGCSLEEYLAQFGTMPVKDSLEVIKALAKGLALAHQSGVIHRDIKPANVFICDNEYKLVDFGLVSTMTDETQITATNGVVGSPTYMAPEQLLGCEPAASMDIYALGELLYEMLTSSPPFDANDCVELISKKLNDKAKPLELSVQTKLPKGLSELVADMLDRCPEKRPIDCEALIGYLNSLSRDDGYPIPEQKSPKVTAEKPSTKFRSSLYLPIFVILFAFLVLSFRDQPTATNVETRNFTLFMTDCGPTWCAVDISSSKRAFLSIQVARADAPKVAIQELKQVRGRQWKLFLTDLEANSNYLLNASFAANKSKPKKQQLLVSTTGYEKTVLKELENRGATFRPALSDSKLVYARPNSPIISFDLRNRLSEIFSAKKIEGQAFIWRDRVVFLQRGIELICFDCDGNEHWSTKLKKTCHIDPMFYKDSAIFHFQKNGFTSINMLNGTIEWAIDDTFMGYPWNMADGTILHQDEFLKGSFLNAKTGKRIKLKTFYPFGSTLDAVATLGSRFAVATDAQRLYLGKPGFPPSMEMVLPGSCHNLLAYGNNVLCHLKDEKEIISIDTVNSKVLWRQQLPSRNIIFVGFDTLVLGLSRRRLITINPVNGALGDEIQIVTNWNFGLHQWKQHLICSEGNKLCQINSFFPPVLTSCLLTNKQYGQLELPKVKKSRSHSHRARNR